MATTFIQKLDSISAPGTTPKVFLKKLGPIHFSWHHQHNAGQAEIGFLLFHWELIQRFKKIGADAALGGITPFSLGDLTNFNSTYTVNVAVANQDIAAFQDFSDELELWHGDAHMNIGMAIHKNLMNPRTNVKIPAFSLRGKAKNVCCRSDHFRRRRRFGSWACGLPNLNCCGVFLTKQSVLS